MDWLESIMYELDAVKFFLRRNQITKAYLRATFCCEFADEMLLLMDDKL